MMQSKIAIEVDFNNNNQPVIQILQNNSNSDDIRDKLLSHFLQQLQGSSWCQIKWVDTGVGLEFNRIHISPITPHQYQEQSEKMKEELKDLIST